MPTDEEDDAHDDINGDDEDDEDDEEGEDDEVPTSEAGKRTRKRYSIKSRKFKILDYFYINFSCCCCYC
jgi:hypothetical protein